MADLQATIEFSVELYKFYNVDLFQRGLYQIRCILRVSPRLPVQVETCIPDTGGTNPSACIIGGAGASRVFQILYRNEEVTLRDIIIFRAHLLVDTRHLKESIERAEFSLNVELWFGEQISGSNLSLASSRILQLNFHPGRGLHYHLPVLFDYFHLASITLGIHASLVALHQPYINAPRNNKPWIGTSKLSCRGTMSPGPLEAIFFGPLINSSTKYNNGSMGSRLTHGRQVHREICALLLSAIESLKTNLTEFSTVLSLQWSTLLNASSPSASSSDTENVYQRLQKLSDDAKLIDSEDDFSAKANSDIAQLCAECILFWRRVLSASNQPSVHSLLAKKHHTLRVRRFAEGFFVALNPRHATASCYDTNYQSYVAITEIARRSRYMATLPQLPVHCTPLDGDSNSLPLIFEDRYSDTPKYSRRRTGSDPHLNNFETITSSSSSSLKPVAVAAQSPSAQSQSIQENGCKKFNLNSNINCKNECACSRTTLINRPIEYPAIRNYVGVMTPRFALGGEILQASLSIAPAAAAHNNGMIQRTYSRHSVTNALDRPTTKCDWASNGICLNSSNNTCSLPTRHSKSLDQLESSTLPKQNYKFVSDKNTSSPFNNTNIINNNNNNNNDNNNDCHYNHNHHHHHHQHISYQSNEFATCEGNTIKKVNHVQAEDLLRNINEFREKYKNPGDSNVRKLQSIPVTVNDNNDKNDTCNGNEINGNHHFPHSHSLHQHHHQYLYNNVSTLNRIKNFNEINENDKKDFLHKLKSQKYAKHNNDHNSNSNSCYYNSLPKGAGMSIPPRNSYPPVRSKKQYSKSIQSGVSPPLDDPKLDTFLRSNSSTILLKQSTKSPASSTNHSLKLKHNNNNKSKNPSLTNNGIGVSSSSSSDTELTISQRKSFRKRLLSSTSVPFKLENLETDPNTSFSESLPNLAPPPPEFVTTPTAPSSTIMMIAPNTLAPLSCRQQRNSSQSTSSLSEQSGWVSSRKSSGISSPETLKDENHKILNGEQLRKKLLKLLSEQQQQQQQQSDKDINTNISDNVKIKSNTTNPPVHKKISTITVYSNINNNKNSNNSNNNNNNNKNYKSTERSSSIPNGKTESIINNSDIKKIKDEGELKDLKSVLDFNSKKSRKITEKSKSDFDLTALIITDNLFDNINKLPPPPQQFSDIPLPPDEFRDPPSTSSMFNDMLTLKPTLSASPVIITKLSEPNKINNNNNNNNSIAFDNPLYHIYEDARTVIKSQSSSELTTSRTTRSTNDLIDELISKKHERKSSSKRLIKKLNSQEQSNSNHFFHPTMEFEKCREEFRKHINYVGQLYSDYDTLASELPYFHISDEYRSFSPSGLHLIICVHGLDGNSADLRLVRTYLELGLPGAHLDFLMSERNQGDTFSDFDTMTDRLVGEILYHIDTCGLNPLRISFVAHSLGTIIVRSALARSQMRPLLPRLHTFLSLSGPHLGTLYNTSGLVNMGMWFMQKWKKSGSLLQLCLRDTADYRQSFLYRLSQKSTLHHFKNVLLCGSSQDRYVPPHSARLELCKAAIRDTSNLGTVYREMTHNIIAPMLARPELTLARFDIHHALPHTANALIGRAAHIAVLDSELFIEKFLLVAGLKYFS